MQFFCYHNGQFKPRVDVSVSTTDLGFTRGYAAFELIRTYGYTPFYLKEHLERFKNNANALLLNYPDNVEKIVYELLEKNNCQDLVIRLYLSEDESGESHFLILCDPIQVPPREQYENGIAVITSSHTRHFHLIKSTCYLAAILALKEAAKKKAEDALFKNSQGHLLEFTKSNFFAVINGTLYTPKDEILLGITRAIVINLAQQLSIQVIEAPIRIEELPNITEAFSTSTIRELLPISQIDSQKLPLGPITQTLSQAFPSGTLQTNIF